MNKIDQLQQDIETLQLEREEGCKYPGRMR